MATVIRNLDVVEPGVQLPEEFEFDTVPDALGFAASDIGTPGIESVVVYFDDDALWNEAWGSWRLS